MDIGQVKEYILSYTLNNCALGNQGYNRVLVQLMGFLGHGKSSLINSCKYSLHGKEFKVHAESGSADGGLTIVRKSYPLTNTITMVDNRGGATLNPFETGEFYTQLDRPYSSRGWGHHGLIRQKTLLTSPNLCVFMKNETDNRITLEEREDVRGNFVPLDKEVEWTKEFGDVLDRLEDSDIEPNFHDIIVPVFVYSMKREIAPNEVEEIKTFLKGCRELTGIFPIIVLTHKTSALFSKFHDQFLFMGAEEILSVENYTLEDNLKTLGRHLQFLNLIHKVLLNVNFLMSEERNPRKERVERKKFLHKFFHERDRRT
ncbi:uncharacterized protein LOC142656104 isoform X1 [Rhinoderma darwinii]|uniref:uncharacterized protein LOC142656104 isoform X1 n=1 Tax=Rhinoderma darwinii TaxID=43563 RepID=UPI003F67B962